MVLKASSPVRHLSFSPSASQPFTLLAACASGTLIRYDVRYISKQNGGATDRVAGHLGACLAMDWRDGFSCERNPPGGGGGPGSSVETAGGGREGGWVVTGGVDRTIKVWDFSLSTLSTKPVRTLYTSQPVSAVAWHPTRATELVSCPMPSLGLGGAAGEGSASSLGDEPPTTPVTSGDSAAAAAAFVKGEPGGGRGRFVDGNAWKNEIEVWDVRRPYFPKVAIKVEAPTAGASPLSSAPYRRAPVVLTAARRPQRSSGTTTRRSGRPPRRRRPSRSTTSPPTRTRSSTASTARRLPGTSRATSPSSTTRAS